jgi:hypothetical protein
MIPILCIISLCGSNFFNTYHYQMIRGDPNPASHGWNEEEISDVEKEKGVSNEEVRYCMVFLC